MRRAAVVLLRDESLAGRAQLRQIRADGVSSVLEAIRAIESGTIDTVLLANDAGRVMLKEVEIALADDETCCALIGEAGPETGDVEIFEMTGDICEVLKTASLAVYYRFLPAGPGRASQRPWLTSSERRALIEDRGASLILRDPGTRRHLPATTFSTRSLKMIPMSAAIPEELERQLTGLAESVRDADSLEPAARAGRLRCRTAGSHRFRAAVIARTPAELRREIESIRQGIGRATGSGAEWRTPAGSCFTANPLGDHGVAFVYPGVASPYRGLGSDLFAIAPGLMDRFAQIAGGNPSRYLHVEDLYPRDRSRQKAFLTDVVPLGECASSISTILTLLMRDVFGVQPRSALGYSFGEAIMAVALGIWPDPTLLTGRLDRSATFRVRLQGPLQAIRECWGVSGEEPVRWRSYSVRATPAEAYAAVRQERRVYLSIINSPEQVVISGDEESCGRVLARFGSAVVPMPIGVTMHCEPARAEHGELVRIHDLETVPQTRPLLFSSANYEPVPANRAALAQAIATGYTTMLDFPRLVRKVYAEGARVFLELGGRRNCCTWIEKTLAGRPHAAIPCDSEGATGETSLLRAVARLFVHGVPLDFTPLGG